MHVVLHLIPLDGEARPVGAEDGIRRVGQIGLRVVSGFRDHGVGIVAGGVAVEGQLHPPQPLRIGRQRVGVVPDLRRGDKPLQRGQRPGGLRRVEFAAHGADVRDGAADLLRGHGQAEFIPWLQQDGFRLHQSLTDRPVGRLPKIPALCVL